MATFGTAATILLLALSSIASATNFKECRSFFNYKVGTPPLNVTLGNCEKYPCDLVRGMNVSGGMDFVYGKELSVLRPVITVYVAGLPINWPMNQEDGCTSLSHNKCPVKAGTRARYEYSLYLGPRTPLVQPLMRFEFRNARGDTTICAEMPIRILPNPDEKNLRAKLVEDFDSEGWREPSHDAVNQIIVN
ncbi:NPC intracellular cholesterol transporter 2-like [Cloeon dipterum]|uniref:NPC intracellular cholesterol transporter 2-like n=1 Tax=Cloeon dipterum TaxID=197152 RepID=UPI00321FFA0F